MNAYVMRRKPCNDRPGETSGLDQIGDNINGSNAQGHPPLFVAFDAGCVDEAAAIIRRKPGLYPNVRCRDGVVTLEDLVNLHFVKGNRRIARQLGALLNEAAPGRMDFPRSRDEACRRLPEPLRPITRRSAVELRRAHAEKSRAFSNG
jgi:hypothetical protein